MSEPTPEPSIEERLAAAEWLVWFARHTKGKAADVARLAMEQNPYLFPFPAQPDLRAAVQAHIDWQYRALGARRFTLSNLRAALSPQEPKP